MPSSHLQPARYEFIDLMKGLSIILIVIFHIKVPGISGNWIMLFTIPLFFISSGFFFSRYENFKIFSLKKINSLLIPYIFFSIIPYIIVIVIYLKYPENSISSIIDKTAIIQNGPLWFIRCLFCVSFMYYFISMIKNEILKTLIVISISYVGYLVGKYNIYLPLNISTSLLVIIFYHIGFIAKKNKILQDSRYLIIKFAISILAFSLIAFTVTKKELNFDKNIIPISYYLLIVTALLGVL